jgi:hypothetical protein
VCGVGGQGGRDLTWGRGGCKVETDAFALCGCPWTPALRGGEQPLRVGSRLLCLIYGFAAAIRLFQTCNQIRFSTISRRNKDVSSVAR